MKIVIATIKSWNLKNAVSFKEKYKDLHEIKIIDNKEELSVNMLEVFSPDYIFFPHWSYKIPSEIYETYKCIVFHMTDLPYGRGGSPLQNLIVRGFHQTKISAVKVDAELDAGAVYLKRKVGLEGSADEIYRRISSIVFEELIPKIIEERMDPEEQVGEPVIFKRRTPEQSEMKQEFSLEQIYDYIRMLDAEGYPQAFLRWGKFKFTFQGAKFDQKKIRAFVEIEEEHK